MKKYITQVWEILCAAGAKYGSDNPIQLSGTLSFITIFAIPPILMVLTAAVGSVIGKDLTQGKIYDKFDEYLGEEAASQIEEMVSNYKVLESDATGTIFGIILFIIASTTVFIIIQKSLNYIWRVKPTPNRKFIKFIKNRMQGFLMIIILGALLLASLLLDGMIRAFGKYLDNWLDQSAVIIVEVLSSIVSFTVTALVCAIIYKLLPDVKIKWRVVWVGAAVTALLFSVGKFLIGFGLSQSDIGTMYGAAGTVVIILLWVFYSALIFFFGAEVTHQYSRKFEKGIMPKEHAVRFEILETEKS